MVGVWKCCDEFYFKINSCEAIKADLICGLLGPCVHMVLGNGHQSALTYSSNSKFTTERKWQIFAPSFPKLYLLHPFYQILISCDIDVV